MEEEFSYPTECAVDAISETCRKHKGEKFAMTPESLEVEVPEDFLDMLENDETTQDFVLDSLDKKEIKDLADVDLEKVYEDAIRDYAFKAVMEMFPEGFYEDITDEFLDSLDDKLAGYEWEY